ncbi:MAG: cytochrome b [Gammaproteobacteria bacterium]|nr:cytochrome b [Gammaproteobacteria bacterium]MBU1654879.1 cytochrome b [Gammaproteobacteria bacterium]MBU1960570.1 cytochrome b [Gammaproteobacteria bacterium]
MQWRNSEKGWGVMTILLHWLVALTVIGLFGLGLWMTGLDYYHPWRHRGPDLHRAIGILLPFVLLLRLAWRFWSPPPLALPDHRLWEARLARIAHALLYLLPFAMVLSGYLISTADGRGVSILGWFEVPALFTAIDRQEEVMGRVHATLAWGLMGVSGVHALGALKHHFIDRDKTLSRMLRIE